MSAPRVDAQRYVLFPAEAARASESVVGGKAFGLVRLEEAGARVPPWCVVSAAAFAEHLRAARLDNAVRAELEALARGEAQVEETSSALRRAVASAPVPDPVRAAVAAAASRLGPGAFAVRSSMVGEDSRTRSYAGLLDSYLYVEGADAILDAVLACWGSAFSARVLSYRLTHGDVEWPPQVGVVLQRMITGDCSGVLFTADPVSGHTDRALLTATWGLCEGVVSGECNTDEYVVDRQGRERAARIADKDLAVRRSVKGTGTVPVPEAQRRVRCLEPADVLAICQEGFRLADAFGVPLDLEWTRAGESLYVLQARPITSLPQPAVEGERVVWDNSNIQESFCGVTTPLTFSFAQRAYASVYRQTMRALGVPEAVVQAHEPVVQNLLGFIRGRVYYNINNWYRALLLLPSFKRNKEDMERMMGLDEPVDFVEGTRATAGEVARRLPGMLATFARLQARFATLESDVERFMAHFDDVLARIDRDTLSERSLPALMEVLRVLDVELLHRWETPIVNDIRVMMSHGRLRRLVERAAGDDEAPAILNDLLSGDEGLESVEPTRWLLRLARVARENAELRRALCAGSPRAAFSLLHERHPAFAEELGRYLERYGDRCAGELKLETVSHRSDPSFVIGVLRAYVARPDLDPDALAERESTRRERAEARVSAALDPARRLAFRRVLKTTRAAIRARERMRLARTWLFGVHRDVFLAVGQRLREAGRLAEVRDVFYLTLDEIVAYHEGRAVATDLAALVAIRKAEHAAYEWDDLPHRIETRGAVYHGNDLAAAPVEAGGASPVLRGLGCSAGVVEAPLEVIRDPQGAVPPDGKILTALRTDPGWAPLFPAAKGILVERGSTLSHSAVLARELGIPAVVGVKDLLRTVNSGERVRLDGGAGTVERLD